MNNFDRHVLAAIDGGNNDSTEPPVGGLDIMEVLRFISRFAQTLIGELNQQMNAISLARVLPVFLCILAAAIFGMGCATYAIPKHSFDNQTKMSPRENMKSVRIHIPVLGIRAYPSNGIEYIICEDDKHHQITLKSSPSIEVKFTKANGGSIVMFFDSIFRTDSLVVGLNSRVISESWDTISISNIRTIKIQDGKKNYSYVM